MKAIILARVSTDEQQERGNSLPAQVSRLEDYCNRADLDIDKTFTFQESAYKQKRDEFDKALDYIDETNEDRVAVCFDKVDRLSRNVFDKRVSKLYNLALKGIIELHFASENLVIDESISATEKFHFNMSLGLAKYYSDAIGDNVKRAFEKKRKAGEYTGPAPFGYKNVPLDEDKRLRKDIVPDDNAEYVKEWFKKYATGEYSYKRLEDEYSKNGVKTNSGKMVHSSFIHQVLSNPFYYGVARSNKYRNYEHQYKPIISKTLWDKVQKVSKKKVITL